MVGFDLVWLLKVETRGLLVCNSVSEHIPLVSKKQVFSLGPSLVPYNHIQLSMLPHSCSLGSSSKSAFQSFLSPVSSFCFCPWPTPQLLLPWLCLLNSLSYQYYIPCVNIHSLLTPLESQRCAFPVCCSWLCSMICLQWYVYPLYIQCWPGLLLFPQFPPSYLLTLTKSDLLRLTYTKVTTKLSPDCMITE